MSLNTSSNNPGLSGTSAVWQMPFRPFFLCATTFGLLAIPLWLSSLLLGIPIGGVSLQWHVHEMLMGFAATVVLGFVLTAAQTWTGIKTVQGSTLMLMVVVWVCARLGWLAPPPWQWLGALADVILFTCAAAVIARMVYLSRNWRNAFFVPVLLLFALFSASYAYALANHRFEMAQELQYFVFYLIVHVVLVVGGRVIPFFADRRLPRDETPRFLLLESLALISSLVFLVVISVGANTQLLQLTATVVATANLLRWLSWKPWQTLKIPLLWSLYLAYAFIIAGFVATAVQLPSSVAMHLISIGGVSLMILAMISRVSLGHSGRPLELPAKFPLAYVALVLATCCRVLANLAPQYYAAMLWLSAIFWITGFGLFVYHYAPILLSARPDGRPG
jgi:uncharacterized protein involved in response to NO